MPTKTVIKEVRRLEDAWRAIVARNEQSLDPNIDGEQTAWDALVDYVDANELDYTEFDPRCEG